MSLKQKFLRSSLALLIVSAPLAVAQPSNYVRGQVLVQFRPGVSDAQAQSALGSVGGRSAARLSQIGVHVVSLPAGANEEAVANALSHRPDVSFAELDRIVPPSVIPNDPWYANWEWHLQKISAPTAWNTTTGANGVTIAILDSGVDGTHEDLISKMVAGWNVYDNNSNTSDVNGHGTMVAGTAGAASNNGVGVASVCWNCWIMPVRISDTTGSATYANIAAGLTWAADHGARVANISYIVSTSSTVTSAAQYMQSRGGVTVSSAGNYTTFDPSADNPYILTVSGSDPNDALYSWSNTGNNVDLAAPGCVYTTTRGGGYSNGCGTSFSAPIVAGVAGLVISVNPSMTGAQITSQLQQTADDLGPAGKDASFGYGRVNAARAVGAPTSDTTLPTVSITSPSSGATVSASISIQAAASDNVGVTSVSFYVDGGLTCTATVSPYACAWNTTTAANGAHSLSATARDAAGNASTASRSVTVSNATPDTTPPAVSTTAPSAGATVSGTISIQAAASDNVAVASVSFYTDGALRCTATSAPYACAWNTTGASNGAHTVSATARDAAGNSTSSSIPITISNVTADTTPPTVFINSPGSGATVSGTISIQASASDNVGVASVSYYTDGALRCTATAAPYACSWNTTSSTNGAHTVTATARDAAGNTASASISVNVNNVVAPADTSTPLISITSPTSGARVSGNVSVTVNAWDNVGVVKVDLYVDGVLTATSTSAPWATKWNTNSKQVAAGAHTIQTKAYDRAGNAGTSAALTVYK